MTTRLGIRTEKANESEDGQIHHFGQCMGSRHTGDAEDIHEVTIYLNKNFWLCIPCWTMKLRSSPEGYGRKK